jgi:hypothetical protein
MFIRLVRSLSKNLGKPIQFYFTLGLGDSIIIVGKPCHYNCFLGGISAYDLAIAPTMVK